MKYLTQIEAVEAWLGWKEVQVTDGRNWYDVPSRGSHNHNPQTSLPYQLFFGVANYRLKPE